MTGKKSDPSAVFEDCKRTCGECKSACIEQNNCDLLTICDLSMLACTQMIMCMRRPSHCDAKLHKHIQAHCKHILSMCCKACKKHGHDKCAKACEKAHASCCN